MSTTPRARDADGANADVARTAARYLDPFLDHLRIERGLSEHTITGYAHDVRRYLACLVERGVERPPLATREDVEAHVARERRGRKTTSVARGVSAVRSFHRFLVAEGLAKENPTSKLPTGKRGRELPKSLSRDEVERLLASPVGDDALARRDRALLELAYATGTRASELVGLTFARLSLEDRLVRVLGKGSKERLVPFGEAAREALDHYVTHARPRLVRARTPDAVFLNFRGGALTRSGYWRILRKHAARAGLPDVHPHTLRHACATHLVAGGADLRLVQELLGHASISTTEIYTHVDRSRLIEVHRAFHPRA